MYLITSIAFSQDFQNKFEALLQKDDTSGQLKILKEWSVKTPKDPELFIAYFNYYTGISRREGINLSQQQKDSDALVLSDTANGKPVAFLNDEMYYEPSILGKGFNYIDQGILLYPARLDMRFGRIYMMGQTGDFSGFTKAIIESIEYGNKINNAWLWKNGKPVENASQFFLGAIQDYINTIYNTGDNDLLTNMRQISETVLKYFPKHVESLSNVGLTYVLTENYDKALPYFLKAESIAPKDVVVLFNLAETYKRKGDRVKAKQYYNKIIQYGSKDDAGDARKSLESLEK